MSYVERQLIPGERVVFKARPHRVELIGPAFRAAACAALVGAAFAAPNLRVLVVVAAAVLVSAAPQALRYLNTEYVITNRRLCVRTGVFRVITAETVLNKIGTIGVEQDLAGRLFGYGTVVVKGVGGAAEALPRIAAPYMLRRKVHEALAG